MIRSGRTGRMTMTAEPSGAPTSGAAAPSVAPGPAGPLERPIRPAPSYAEALAGVRELQAQDAGADINPISRTRLFLPGGEVGPGIGGGSDPDAGPRAARVYLCF